MSSYTYIRIEGKKDKKAFRRFKKDLKRVLRQIKKDKGIRWASGHDLLTEFVVKQICNDYQYYKEDGFDMYLRLNCFDDRYLLYSFYNESDELAEIYSDKRYGNYKAKGNVWGDCVYGKKN